MSAKFLPVAIFAAACFAAPAFADLRGPAELPPAGFKGQQYVDSRGCVFLRAGYGGRATWVPRVARDRSQLCGYAPSGRQVATAESAALSAPAAGPAKSSGSNFSAATPKPGAPLPKPMQNAFDAGDQTPATTPRRATHGSPGGTGSATAVATGKSTPLPPRKAATASTAFAVPPGYKLAWEDDRLNPWRGLQTAKGIADQEAIWTRTTPAQLHGGRETMVRVRRSDGSTRIEPAIVTTAADGTKSVVLLSDPSMSKSSKATAGTAPPAKAPAAAGRVFVQVGTFGVAANADATAGRLRGLGLPVARSTIQGGALQVVYAGPFATAGDARAALSQVRGVGFGDAVIVQ